MPGTQPDYFLPAIFDLSTSAIQGIQSGNTNPRVVLDSNGVYSTTNTGKSKWILSQKFGGLHVPLTLFLQTEGLTFTPGDDSPTSPKSGIMGISGFTTLAPAGPDPNSAKNVLLIQSDGSAGGISPGQITEGTTRISSVGSELRISNRSRIVPAPFIDRAGDLPGILEQFFGTDAGADASFWTTIMDALGRSDFLQGLNVKVGTLSPIYGQPGGRPGGGASPWTTLNAITLNHPVKSGLIAVWGAGYSPAAGPVGYQLVFDGVAIANTNFFFNTANQHQLLPPLIATVSNLAAGNHTFNMSGFAGSLVVNSDDAGGYIFVG